MKKNHEQKVDPITGIPTLPWYGALIGGFGIYTILVLLAFAIPYPSFAMLPILLPTGTLAGINFIWLRTKPNLVSKFIFQITLAILLAIMSFRAIKNILPDYDLIIGIVIALSMLFAHSLPMWNPTATKFIRDSLTLGGDKSGIQRFLSGFSLILLGMIFAIGFVLDLFFQKQGMLSFGQSFMIGAFFGVSVIILPFSDPHPCSPWEKNIVLARRGSPAPPRL